MQGIRHPLLWGALAGGALACTGGFLSDPWGGFGLLPRWISGAYDAIGIVVLGLLPLFVWSLKLTLEMLAGRSMGAVQQMDYAYISRTATLLGLLGTVISLGLATSRLGGEVAATSAEAILKVIPLTGQALVSTVAGLVVSMIAETALHVVERKTVAAQ